MTKPVLQTKAQTKPDAVLSPDSVVVKNKAVKPDKSNIASNAQMQPAHRQIISKSTMKVIRGKKRKRKAALMWMLILEFRKL